jgi:hypothetical protein
VGGGALVRLDEVGGVMHYVLAFISWLRSRAERGQDLRDAEQRARRWGKKFCIAHCELWIEEEKGQTMKKLIAVLMLAGGMLGCEPNPMDGDETYNTTYTADNGGTVVVNNGTGDTSANNQMPVTTVTTNAPATGRRN